MSSTSLESAAAAVRSALAGYGPHDAPPHDAPPGHSAMPGQAMPDLSDDAVFDALVRRVHDAQCQQIPALAALAARRGKGPGQVGGWRDLPAVPAGAYKQLELFAASRSPARTFTSSGTSGGPVSRALYSAEGLELMALAISRNARRMLFPDGLATRILVLAPPPHLAPGMIMAYGMDRLITEHGAPGSRFLLAPGRFEIETIVEELERAVSDGVSVTLIGASFGFVFLCDALAGRGGRLCLPPGSRTMDAGGFKGRSREVSPEEMRRQVSDRLAVPPERCVNLLGMTELPSQLYDDGLAAAYERRPALRGKRTPPWMRTTVLDPETLEPCPPGRPGLLQHVDLANVERPLALLTDDMGVLESDGSFHILGRATGAEARGCSLSLEEWGLTQTATATSGAARP